MTNLKDILKNIGQKSREDIIAKCEELKLTDRIETKEDLISFWASYIGPKYYKDSVISIGRQVEILKLLLSDIMTKYAENKKQLIKKLAKEENRGFDKPAWISTNFSDSEKGLRLQIGFKNRGCRYWHDSDNLIGCYNCGYFAGTSQHYYKSLEANEYHKILLKQFDEVELKYKNDFSFDNVNFLGDGSFLNNWEVPYEAQLELFERLADWENVKIILIESRPEYIDIGWLGTLLNQLRPDQAVEIAVGVESTDEFIRTHCINKGFVSLNDKRNSNSFKSVLKNNVQFNGRIKLQAYLLVKPAFLNESEAIQDAVISGKELFTWAKELNPRNPGKYLSIKYEPVVVSRGTLLEVLYKTKNEKGRLYDPLNYWSVVEILCSLFRDGTYTIVRFGAREDMDDYIALPLTRIRNGEISLVDYKIYRAVQKFSTTRYIDNLMSDINSLVKDDSFIYWEKTILCRGSILKELLNTQTNNDIEFEDIIKFIQKDKKSINFFKSIAPNINGNKKQISNSIEQIQHELLSKENLLGDWSLKVKDLRYVIEEEKLIMKFIIINSTVKNDVWVEIYIKNKI